MYFWKIENLKQDIITPKFSEKDRFIYAFIYISLSVIMIEALTYISVLSVEEFNIWDNINSITNIIIPIVGTFYAYKMNGGSQGNDFLGKFFSINFVVSIRFLALLVPLFLLLFFYYSIMVNEEESLQSSPIEIIPFQIWYILLYVRTCKHIRDVRNSQPGD